MYWRIVQTMYKVNDITSKLTEIVNAQVHKKLLFFSFFLDSQTFIRSISIKEGHKRFFFQEMQIYFCNFLKSYFYKCALKVFFKSFDI